MADAKETGPKSFRITEASAQRFKEIAAELGNANQQETMAKLIEAYEFQAGKANLKDRSADIEQFERYVTALSRMYMNSLEDNKNITETVRTEFDALLQSKDAVIQDLQGQLTVAVQLKEEAVSKAKSLTDTNAALSADIKEMKEDYDAHILDLTSSIRDKDNLNRALMETCNGLKVKVADMSDDHEKLLKLDQEKTEVASKLEAIEREKTDTEKLLEQAKSDLANSKKMQEKLITDLKAHETESLNLLREQLKVSSDKAIMDLEKSYLSQIQDLRSKHQEELDRCREKLDQYQQKYFDLVGTQSVKK